VAADAAAEGEVKMKKAILVSLLLAALLLSGCPSGGTGNTALPQADTGDQTAGQASTSISIPLDQISGQAKWFEYDSSGAKIRFFAVKASDGSIRTAFDACDVCYFNKKGYSQQGDFMVCNNCGNKYPISGLGTENRDPGGCWPSYLPNKIEGGKVIVEKADLEKGRSKFA